MNKIIRKDTLSILSELLTLIKKPKEDIVYEMKLLSNKTIHNASIFQDQDSTSIAVIVYAISKLIEQGMVIDEFLLRTLKSAYNQLLDNRLDKYRKRIKYLFSYIAKLDKELNQYIEKVIKYALLKKGSKIYDHGISLAQASSLLGLSQWELSNYIGRTRISEGEFGRVNISRRLSLARKLFEVGP